VNNIKKTQPDFNFSPKIILENIKKKYHKSKIFANEV